LDIGELPSDLGFQFAYVVVGQAIRKFGRQFPTPGKPLLEFPFHIFPVDRHTDKTC
jgi:hypothetical protein